MLSELLECGLIFDWISPTLSIAQDLANGPSTTFLIPVDCGRTGRELANLLRRRGIETWGHMIVNGHFMITVRATQAEFAGSLLQSARIPARVPSPVTGTTSTTTRRGLGDLLRAIGNLGL